MKFEEERYQEIYIPLPDVYSDGGPEGFTEFQRKREEGRNLVVVPLSVIDKLGDLEMKDNSYGAAAALKFLKDLKDDGSKRVFARDSSSFFTYRIFDTSLDVCILNDKEFSKSDFKIGNLERKLRKTLNAEHTEIKVITDNSSQNIKYSLQGARVESPSFLIVNENIVHEGMIKADHNTLSRLYSSKKEMKAEDVQDLLERERPLYNNQILRFEGKDHPIYAIVTGENISNKQDTRIISTENLKVRLLHDAEYGMNLKYGNIRDHAPYYTNDILGVKPFDMEQYLALQYGLIPTSVPMFFLCGKQGSGKTVLTYAYAIDSILNYDAEIRERRGLKKNSKGGFFEQIILMKAPEILGGKRRDVGALPGDLLMKLKNHLAPYIDAHNESVLGNEIRFEDLFMHPKFQNDFGPARDDSVNKLKLGGRGYLPSKQEAIELVYSGFIGGRSKRNTLLVIDEAQDFTPYEMKTILERVGMGSSIIILGDPMQVRNPICTVKKNGLTYAIKNYLGKPYVGLMSLSRNYRHQISEDSETMSAYSR